MTTYISDLKTISSSEEVVFNILSDLNNLQKVTANPSVNEKVKDLQFDTDSCIFSVDGVGKIGFRVVERIPFKNIKFEAEHSPVEVNVLIDLDRIDEKNTQLKLTLNAQIPTMIKMMIDNKLKDGINAFAEILAKALNTAQ